MKKISLMAVFFLVFCFQNRLLAQTTSDASHQHLVATCVAVAAGEKRPDFGCFIVASARGLQFDQPEIFWHLRTFPTRAAAEEAKSSAAAVFEEDGRVWLSEFGSRDSAHRGGELIAVVGPLKLVSAKSYDAEVAYAIMRPGDRSRVHTHAGPEAWYVLAGEQCLETTDGTTRAHAGETMSVAPSIPMELNITGATTRRAFAMVIHDSAQDWGQPSEWKPTGACGK